MHIEERVELLFIPTPYKCMRYAKRKLFMGYSDVILSFAGSTLADIVL
jgi:hypothetical protein